ncbi:MAG: glycosyltransferase [Butyrivibrio sp.]|uniref:glycosyltransferase family 2 protein n=1 Tax=Butyrivibrio sp. TaxID=28121 RepID=UPI0025F1BD59|nr:glycosyltransferase [Butyrivibrio sp.]MCR5772848.1 glycosyltransferase [Butyrivibrio sp.]
MILQSLLFPDNNICSEEALYFHRKEGFICVDGYFNLFYLEKHHKYCRINSLTLELEIHGIKSITVMHDREEVLKVEALDTGRLSISLPYDKYDTGVLWFKAELDDKISQSDMNRTDDSWSIKGYFEGYSECINPVELAVNICTYKREAYVTRNMKSLAVFMGTRAINGKLPEASRHMHVFIVDNGKSLNNYDEFDKLIHIMDDDKNRLINIIPNANTGGTGGFSRGMQEAINRREELGITHLLMMDDDAVFDPDLFVRLYGFLSTLREEYRDITVGGALMREDYPYIQHAAGEWFTDYKVINNHPIVDMRDFDNCTADWMTGTGSEHDMYGAWWCCCYNMDAINKENMPLPIFVHHDDIQFGMKQVDRGIVFLNGICVWHQGFELVYPGVKQYYNMRNTLITMDMFERKRLDKTYRLWAIRRYIGLLISYRYADCEFVYRGFKDFQKGRDWLLASDPESIHKELMETYRNKCGMRPIEDIGLSSEEYAYVKSQIRNDFSESDLREYYTPDRFRGPVSKKITINGWFLPSKKGIKVITPLDSPWDVYRYKKILLYEPATGKGAVMKRSMKELCLGFIRIVDMLVSKRVR